MADIHSKLENLTTTTTTLTTSERREIPSKEALIFSLKWRLLKSEENPKLALSLWKSCMICTRPSRTDHWQILTAYLISNYCYKH